MDGLAWAFIGFMAFMLLVAFYRLYRLPHDIPEIGKEPCEHKPTPFWCKSCNKLILWTEYRSLKEIEKAFAKPVVKEEDEEIWRIEKREKHGNTSI